MSRRNNTRGTNLSNDQNADAEDNITLHEIAQQGNPMMNLVTRLLQQQNRLLEEMNRGGNAGNGGTLVTLEQFKKLGPPVFKGTTDPLTAEAWLKHIEKVFTAINCPNEQKVIFASFVLQDEADHWWDATSRILRTTLRENNPITWEMFTNAFNEKYFPDRVRFKMERDFLSLRQGSKSVAEYEEQFTSLSRFAASLIPDDESKGRRFLDGLHPDIQSKVEVLKLGRYADIVDRAMIAERSLEEVKKMRDAQNKQDQQSTSRDDGSIMHGTEEHNEVATKGNHENSSQKQNLLCTRCGKLHSGECFWKTGACFQCGQAGHKIKNCPNKRTSSTETLKEGSQNKRTRV
ncbi:hypothetical protein Q3G72_018432 [Acer saccharum]|nr:hypothetical protein Q3G72_018432 [Acer saccharum]